MKQLIFNTHDIILLATIYQCVLFALLIFVVKHERHQNDYFLIGFLLTQAAIPFHILVNYGEAFRFIALNVSPNLYRIFEIAYWLEGPLLLWYTRSLVYRNYRFTRTDLLYLVPVAVYLITSLSSFYLLDHDTKVEFLRNYHTKDAPFWRHAEGFVRECLRVMFSLLCLIEIKHCRQQIRDRYSSVESIDLGWLNLLVIGFTIIRVWAVLVAFAIISSVHIGLIFDFETMGLIGNYITFLLVSALIFFSLSRSSLFEGVEQHEPPLTPEHHVEVNPEHVALIEEHMATQKPFLANILTLEQLAKQLELSPRTLSNVINRHFELNFFEFINRYRVEEAKHLLQNPELNNKTMIEIMAESGFNSKATFNTFFKKLVGSTPSQYRAAQSQ